MLKPGRIRRLSEGTINRIAAGEVVERPASVVKELVENAIDAGATQIDVVFRGGGKTLIRVSDNGSGITAEDLSIAIMRHATSKLSDDALINIATLGFRGEALPSIASVARMAIVSRADAEANQITIEAGTASDISPSSRARGTDVEVRDLFFATPARLKFLKTDRGETAEAIEIVRRLALAHPAVGFSFVTEDRRWLDAPAEEKLKTRIGRILGPEFLDNAVHFEHRAEDVTISGYAGLPTAARAQATQQYAFVNGRPVKDKLITGAVRGAYADVLPPGRHAAIVLYLTCTTDRVDINVHPAKTEVRFRDSGFVRGLIVSGIRRALAQRPARADTTLAAQLRATPPQYQQASGFSEAAQAAFTLQAAPAAPLADSQSATGVHYPLGAARAQVHDNYIITQTERGMVLVDQHAAHERIVYERLKAERAKSGVESQPLLVPQVIDMDGASIARLLAHASVLQDAGLHVESFGDQSVIVREIPAALSGGNIAELLRDIADDETAFASASIDEQINRVLATFACHHSVRSGRTLRADEMNALLRQIEQTPNGGECNHGRPTFVEITVEDIERLFRRR